MSGASSNLLRHVQHLVEVQRIGSLSDQQLLERFATERDETAFAVLVRRHGPMVLRVCRRVLGHEQDAEDAFQAAFLILARKGGEIRKQAVGCFLYRVAYHLAIRARGQKVRRLQHVQQNEDALVPDLVTEVTWREVRQIVDEETQRLPEKLRSPLVLCFMENKTQEEAAQLLGWSKSTLRRRLSQARERLRRRLLARGLAPMAALTASLLPEGTASAMPVTLVSATVRAAVAGSVSPAIAAFVEAGVALNSASKAKVATTLLLTMSLLGGASVWFSATPQAAVPSLAQSPVVQADDKKAAPPKPVAAKTVEIQDRVLEPDGKPKAEAKILLPGKPLPNGAVARMGSTQMRHGDAVSFAAYTPDGKALVTAGRDKMVRLWDLTSGEEIRRFAWDEGEPGGRPEPSEDGIAQRREQQYWDDSARSFQAALSADGKIVAASRGGIVRLWETASGKTLRELQTGEKRLLQLAFAADSKSLLTLSPGQATAVWDVATGKCVRSSPGKPVPQFFAPIGLIEAHNALVSPGLKYLAFRGEDNNGSQCIHLLDLESGKELRRIKASPGTLTLTFSADDKILVFENPESGIVVADVATGWALRRLKSDGRNDSRTSEDSALAIALSPDGKRLAVSWMSNTIELWDLKSGKQMLPIGKVPSAQYDQQSTNWRNLIVRPALAFSPDSKKLVCSLGGATIRQFQADTGAEIPDPGTGHRAPVSTLALSADGKSLYTHSHSDPIRCWDWITGKESRQREVSASATHAVFTADGRFAFIAGHDFAICSADGKQTRKIAAGESLPWSLALSPDGALLATRIFLRPEVHLWDATTLKERYTLGRASDEPAAGAVTETTGVLPPDLVFSPDGRYLAADGPSRQLCLWDVSTGALLWELPPRAGQAIERFAFSQCGRVLATIHADRTMALYEVVSGAKRVQLGKADPKLRRVYLTDGSRGPEHSVQMRRDAPVCLAFSRDGRYLALAQNTPEIHLWDVHAGREVGQLTGHEGGVVSLLFAPDGKHLFSGGTDTSVLSWDLTRLPRPEPTHAAELPAQALDGLWTDLAGKDATRAFDAIRKLSASPEQAVTLLKDRVRPAMPADPKRLARLLGDLESDRYEVRRQAQSELEGLGELAVPAMRKALAGDTSLDVRRRLERLLDNFSGQARLTEQLGGLRTVELLELIGSLEARQQLQVLADGAPEARLTQEARSAIRRLTK